MPENKQKQLAELRLDSKIAALNLVLESLKNDKWSDVANLGKNTYAACVKEEISLREERNHQFARMMAVGDKGGARKFVKSEIVNTQKLLTGKGGTKSKGRRSND